MVLIRSFLSFNHFSNWRLFIFFYRRLAKVELISVFILLDEEDEVGSLQRSQDGSNSIDHILQLDTFLFDLIFYIFKVVDQRLKQKFLLLQKLSLALYLPLLFFCQIQSVLQLDEPLIFLLLLTAKQMPSFRGRPHHVAMQGREA